MNSRWKQALVIIPMLVCPVVLAQSDDEEEVLEEVAVSGLKVTAGGAQDIAFARSEILSGRIPHPNTFTDEGLLSQHDLTLPDSSSCDQLFCVFGEAVRSEIVTKPDDQYFVGLGFATNIDAKDWRRDPVNIVAVVDKSGSMGGTPLHLVRRSLLALTSQLGPSDQLSIVLYGDRSYVHMNPILLTKENANGVREKIRSIGSSGSTYMEEGLRVGYRVAKESAEAFDGTTRLILFTDERPNVGDTSAEGFIGMAREASEYGVGLTTIGVGVQFDSSLAVKVSSTRGGNLFFVPDEEAADRIFAEEFDYMVSELAHDLNFVLRPHPDYEITGVYGLPGEMLSWGEDRAVTFTIPTVFLSGRGGGIFVTLAARQALQDLPAPAISGTTNLLAAAITYLPVRGDGSPQTDLAEVSPEQGEASRAMQKASLLVDQYLALRLATTEHYLHNNQEAAYQALRNLDVRFSDIEDRRLRKELEPESDTVSQLLEKFAFLSGHSSEVEATKAARIWGVWQITDAKLEDPYGDFEVEVGNYILISPDNRMAYAKEDDYSDADWDDAEPFLMSKSGLLFLSSDYLVKYTRRRDKLTLEYRDREETVDVRITMVFASEFPTTGFVPEDADYFDE